MKNFFNFSTKLINAISIVMLFAILNNSFNQNIELIKVYNEQKEYDTELIYDRIKRTNLFIRTDELGSMDYELLVKKISEDLGVELNIDLSQINKTYFKNDASERLFNSLDQSEKDSILENFKLDKEIYENDSLFWNPSR